MGNSDLLHELLELSSQVREVAVASLSGDLVAAVPAHRGAELARAGSELLAAAASLRPGGPPVARVEVVLPGGAVVVVAEGDRIAAATTVPEPTAGLVVYDLRTLLRRLVVQEDVGAPSPSRSRPRRTSPDA